MSEWQTIETAPKDRPIEIASFAPGAVWPTYIVMAQWQTISPSYTHCASKSWWYVEGPMLEEKVGSHRFRVLYGFLPHYKESRSLGDHVPTHWRELPPPPAP